MKCLLAVKASQQGGSFKVNSSLTSPCSATKVGYVLSNMALPSTYDGHRRLRAMAVTMHVVLGAPEDMLVLNLCSPLSCSKGGGGRVACDQARSARDWFLAQEPGANFIPQSRRVLHHCSGAMVGLDRILLNLA